MDALDEYGSSDNESAGAPASNAVPAALTSPPGSPSIRNAAQALVQFSQGAAHQVTAQHKPRPRLVVPPTGTSSASTATIHMRDTPRDDSQLLDPPPPGSTWTWQPDVITADGANAGPNAIRAVCLESDPAYDPLRVHCHVHLKRDVQQNKHDLFKNSCTDTASVKDCASATTTMIEQVKSNSISPELAQLGKEMIVASLQSDSHDEAADYIAKFVDKIWTLVESNHHFPAGGAVPTHQNSIERSNLGQKIRKDWVRAKIVAYMEHNAQDLAQESMDDIMFGAGMPRCSASTCYNLCAALHATLQR